MSAEYAEKYNRWKDCLPEGDLKNELTGISGNDEEIQSRFAKSLEFGTAGLRGILGAGSNRMNEFTVRQATQGLADYVTSLGGGSVAIAYDSRHFSVEFARESASVLAANGIKVYLYKRLMPTPILSFTVRRLSCAAGIMITASHNPAEYNGYKAYGSDGCQMTTEAADDVFRNIQATDIFSGVKTTDFDCAMASGAIQYVSEDVLNDYYAAVSAQMLNLGICRDNPIRLVYSPLNGTGREPVLHVLNQMGIKDINIVKPQEFPDGAFPTCTYPNPETKAALQLGLNLCAETDAELFLATDPDADRLGVAIRDGKGYRILTGNEVGILLLQYIAHARRDRHTMPENPVAVRSIVSTPMADLVAAKYGVQLVKTLTGFKWIGDQILRLEQKGQENRFIFGFEESCGYLSGSYCRDKDAVFAAMMMCELCAYNKSKGISIVQLLDSLYKEFGYYRDKVISISFDGLNGITEMNGIMDSLFACPPNKVAGYTVKFVSDYRSGIRSSDGKSENIELPSSDVLELGLEKGIRLIIRPSGTEPKMKVYITVRAESEKAAITLLDEVAFAAEKMVK